MSNIYEHLRILTQADLEPGVTEQELNFLLERFAVIDSEGRSPQNPEWQPTCDLNAAAAEGWRIKAGKFAHQHDVTVDAQDFNASQKHAQCMAMAERFAKKVKASFSSSSSS
jgi:hypothetical protein